MNFDYQGALKAGAKKEDILKFLGDKYQYDYQGAIKAGAKDDDIINFLATKPVQTQQEAPIQQDNPSFFKSLLTDPLKTLVIKPGVRLGQALGYGVGKAFGIPEENLQKAIQKDVNVPTELFGDIRIEGQKPFGEGGGKQIIGDAAKTASYLYTGGGAGTAISTGLKGEVISAGLQGTKTGAIGGGLYSFGDAIQNAENQASDVAYQTLFGTAVGGATGGVLGAVFPVVANVAGKTRKFTNVNALNSELTTLNNKTLRPTPSQESKWIEQKVNPIKTYTEIFSTEVPQVDKQNRFVRESVEDFIGRVDEVYRPGAEGFNTILRNSPEVNSLSKMEREALSIIDSENLTPVQRQQAKAKIQAEIQALRVEAQTAGKLLGDDNIPVAYTDNFKDRFWANTRYFGDETTSVTNSANRAMGRIFAKNIEDVVTDVNIKNFNKQLQEYIVLKDFLETKAGKLAGEGGKMSRYITRVVGGMAGSNGGPIGTIVGSITGDKLAQLWINPANSPYRWMILQQLKRLPPQERKLLEQQANEVLEKMYQKRIETLALPAPRNGTIVNEGRPIPVMPPNSTGKEFTGGDIAVANEYKPKNRPNMQSGYISTGYKETGNLTTKILKDLEGKTTVSKQYILDATNRGELKQVERDLIREVLATEKGDTINVQEFADKVKAELLPLKVKGSDTVNPKFDQYSSRYMQNEGSFSTKYDNMALPDELRGKVANYRENIYESPVATSAGDVHFGYQTKNYFGHTRIEDMADNKTRRVIEVQSDLYQKGNLEKEKIAAEFRGASGGSRGINAAKTEITKLEQYNDPTAHFRMVREEIKKAAQDGKTKLQFPTGETALRIEGLVDTEMWNRGSKKASMGMGIQKLEDKHLRIGEIVNDGNTDWIVSNKLGVGKFKALPKDAVVSDLKKSFPNISEKEINDFIILCL